MITPVTPTSNSFKFSDLRDKGTINANEILDLQKDISRQISLIQQKCNQKLLVEKEKKKKMKEQRDYQIYDEMGYTFNSKIYSLAEKHPMSRDRFESAK